MKDYIKQLAKPHKKEVRKAAVSGIVAGGLALLGLWEITGEMTVEQALGAGGVGIVDYILVYFSSDGRK